MSEAIVMPLPNVLDTVGLIWPSSEIWLWQNNFLSWDEATDEIWAWNDRESEGCKRKAEEQFLKT
jgi:hypothetical protein